MSILLIVLSWAVFAFMTWFTYRFIRDMIAASKKRKPMATMNGKLYVYSTGTTNPKSFYVDDDGLSMPKMNKIVTPKEAHTKMLDDFELLTQKADDEKKAKRAPKKHPAMTAPIIPKGWIRNKGKCPVKSHRTVVEVMYRDGERLKDNRFTNPIIWGISSDGEDAADIIAYRIVKPKRKPQTKGKAK